MSDLHLDPWLNEHYACSAFTYVHTPDSCSSLTADNCFEISTMVMREGSQWLERNIVRNICERHTRKAMIVGCPEPVFVSFSIAVIEISHLCFAIAYMTGEENRKWLDFKLFNTQSRLLTTLKKKPLKTLRDQEKMLVTSIFSFSHNIFCSIKDRNRHFNTI